MQLADFLCFCVQDEVARNMFTSDPSNKNGLLVAYKFDDGSLSEAQQGGAKVGFLILSLGRTKLEDCRILDWVQHERDVAAFLRRKGSTGVADASQGCCSATRHLPFLITL